MADIITRVYGSYENALAAVNELKLHRFTDSEITVVASPGSRTGGGSVPFDAVVNAIAAGWVLKSEAAIYALSVMRGASLVTVRAPFGAAGNATAILDKHHPVESGVPMREFPRMRPWDEAAPASSVLHMSPLADPDSSLSAILGLPLLAKRGRTLCAVLHVPELVSRTGAKATLLGPAILKGSPRIMGATVIRRPAYLSSALHIKLLLSHDASLSRFLDMPWLRRIPAPLSSLLHIPTLINSAASLSGLPTLSRGGTVSSRVGIPTLTRSRTARS
jgi:hypothetical protein